MIDINQKTWLGKFERDCSISWVAMEVLQRLTNMECDKIKNAYSSKTAGSIQFFYRHPYRFTKFGKNFDASLDFVTKINFLEILAEGEREAVCVQLETKPNTFCDEDESIPFITSICEKLNNTIDCVVDDILTELGIRHTIANRSRYSGEKYEYTINKDVKEG